MTQEEDDIALIESYLQEKLQEHDRIAFEHRLQTDPGFNELFRKHRWIVNNFERMRYDVAKEQVQKLTQSEEIRKQQRWKGILPFLILAMISLAVLIIVNRNRDRPAPEPAYMALANTFYEAPDAMTSRSTEEAFSETFSDGMSDYAKKDWAAAIADFRNVDSGHEKTPAQYYIGHCYFNLEEYAHAIAAFEVCLDDDNFRQQADWFIALSFLKNNDTLDAQNRLKNIAGNPGHFYSAKAADILEKL